MKNKGTLILVSGLPGAGKTTLAKQLETELSGIRFCPDEWMLDLGVSLWDAELRQGLENRFWQLGKQLIASGQTVILEYGFWAKSERDEKRDEARELGANVEFRFLNLPEAELRERLRKRGMEGDDLILESKLSEWLQVIEIPNEEELKQYDNYVTE